MLEIMNAVTGILSGLLLGAGCAFCMIGAVGLLRFPDFFTRVHAAGMIDSAGMLLILLGLMLKVGFSLTLLKLGLVLVFMFISSPTAVHALAQAALHGGMKAPSED